MSKYDWSNIDWGALAKSQVMIGNIVTIVSIAAAAGGHAIPAESQTQLSSFLTAFFTLLATGGVLFSSFHRVVAQPENATTILPKKTPDQPPTGDVK